MPTNTVIDNIRADTTGITDSAFDGCTGLTSVTIPSSVVFIERLTFEGCYNLDTITVSRGTIIAEGAFPSDVQIVYSD